VSGVLGVQGLKQEGVCESRLLSSQFLITNSRLGELSLVPIKLLMCVMIFGTL